MSKLEARIRAVLEADRHVTLHDAAAAWNTLRGTVLIAAGALGVMSALNIVQHSWLMLVSTAGCALVLLLALALTAKRQRTNALQIFFVAALAALFTVYTVFGGNDGFAVLWIVLGPYVAMMAVDLRKGFAVSCYFFLMLFALFLWPLPSVLRYAYNATFMLRFPFFYLINFAFATFLAVRIRLYQHTLLLNQQELERLSSVDLTTGLLNRNSFNRRRDDIVTPQAAPVSAVFIDVNGLHEVNNQHGHEAGDRMLRTIASLCTQHFPTGEVFRVGGDEMLVLAQHTDDDAAQAQADAFSRAVNAAGYSVSLGVRTAAPTDTADALVCAADMAMLDAKKRYYAAHDRRAR